MYEYSYSRTAVSLSASNDGRRKPSTRPREKFVAVVDGENCVICSNDAESEPICQKEVHVIPLMDVSGNNGKANLCVGCPHDIPSSSF